MRQGTYTESCQISKIESFVITVKGFYPLTIFVKGCDLVVWQGSTPVLHTCGGKTDQIIQICHEDTVMP